VNGVLEILGEHRPFLDALGDARRRVPLHTSFSSSELEALDARIRANAFFSARVTNAVAYNDTTGGTGTVISSGTTFTAKQIMRFFAESRIPAMLA